METKIETYQLNEVQNMCETAKKNVSNFLTNVLSRDGNVIEISTETWTNDIIVNVLFSGSLVGHEIKEISKMAYKYGDFFTMKGECGKIRSHSDNTVINYDKVPFMQIAFWFKPTDVVCHMIADDNFKWE